MLHYNYKEIGARVAERWGKSVTLSIDEVITDMDFAEMAMCVQCYTAMLTKETLEELQILTEPVKAANWAEQKEKQEEEQKELDASRSLRNEESVIEYIKICDALSSTPKEHKATRRIWSALNSELNWRYRYLGDENKLIKVRKYLTKPLNEYSDEELLRIDSVGKGTVENFRLERERDKENVRTP